MLTLKLSENSKSENIKLQVCNSWRNIIFKWKQRQIDQKEINYHLTGKEVSHDGWAGFPPT